ncbi:Origin recognition complex, subunit 1, partial [Pseudoloma neurophilia]
MLHSPVYFRSHLQSVLLSHYNKFFSNKKNDSVFITGMPGSGKTHTIRHTFFSSSVNSTDEKEIYFSNPDVFYFNCCFKGTFLRKFAIELKKWSKKHSIQTRIQTKIKKNIKKKRIDLSTNVKWSEITSYLKNKTLILDEIDFLKPDDLYRFLELKNLLLICIGNKMIFENRIRSRIGTILGVEAYTAEELRAIAENKTSIKQDDDIMGV